MAYWLREVAGWLLILCGLWLMGIVIEFCQSRWILEAAIVAVLAVFVFRGGIHLLKVAVAARICREAWVREEIGIEAVRGAGPLSRGTAEVKPRRS